MNNKFSREIKINKNITITNKKKAFIDAEISANHEGKLNLLKKTILEANYSVLQSKSKLPGKYNYFKR